MINLHRDLHILLFVLLNICQSKNMFQIKFVETNETRYMASMPSMKVLQFPG
jgi:hypothetical protein